MIDAAGIRDPAARSERMAALCTSAGPDGPGTDLEGAEEVIGTEDDGDGAHGHDGGIDGGGHVPAHGQAGRQERQAR